MSSAVAGIETPERQIAALEAALAKAQRINAVLMDRVERSTDLQGNAFSLFETAIALEGKVRDRTVDLERALREIAATNAALAAAKENADQAQRLLRDAIESINEGFAIFDADDRLVVYNDTYLGLWPKVADRIQPGMTFRELAQLFGEERTTMGAMLGPDRWISERLAQHRVAEGGHVHTLADGRWIQINELRTSAGGIVGVYTDITEVKAEDARQRARELAEKSTLLQATLDAMPHGVCVYDADQRLTAWNRPLSALLDLPAEVGRGIGEHRGLADRLGAQEAVGWLGADEAEEVMERIALHDRMLEVRRAALPGGGMIMSFSDVTEALRAAGALKETADTLERRVEERTADIAAVNRRLQQEVVERLAVEDALRDAKTVAEQANLSKTRFLAAASHDLLQPLNAARLFVSAIADRRLAPPTRALVRQTGSALDSVEDLLEALLEISKLDAGAITPEPVPFALGELLESMRAEFAPIARARGLTLRVQPCDQWVRSDPRLFRRILQNFISNALRYTEQGGVEVLWTSVEGHLRVDVIDTGIGIAAEHHDEIFEEFRRLGEHGRDRGMGLGLAIVERAARMLDLRVTVTSRSGHGSTFGVDLPLAAARDLPAHKEPIARGRRVANRAVMVIDNEPSILEGMAAMLGGWGYRTICVRSGDEAVAVLADGVPDILIADYHLDNGETGDDALRRVRDQAGKRLPAIVITADRTPELRDRLGLEGLSLLTKPVKPAQLRALLSRTPN